MKKWGNTVKVARIKATVNNGEIVVSNDIRLREDEKDLLPAVEFAEDVMKRCADPSSVSSMFDDLKPVEDTDTGTVPVIEQENVGMCSICLEEMKYPSDNAVRILQCRHVFHDACIKQQAEIKRECPLCRTKFFAVWGLE